MSDVFMKIIGRNRSVLPLGHINQTDVERQRVLNGCMISLLKCKITKQL
jgi:hypothetical protein